ncbi:hypothetical protein HO133_008255 [Letharia lupina]|uniref:Major facilitator superfamily (MFS) profile domain-containing protein n=1 Tax=Letharia lupina TaxID=560253 RepID=A0A8H6CRF9_9LECA|nr:uncharacterized protein HO133_008255 [Letharia lupina]KAF6228525.1 hypothetical protein HO133_008255 [Letharia lupina]
MTQRYRSRRPTDSSFQTTDNKTAVSIAGIYSSFHFLFTFYTQKNLKLEDMAKRNRHTSYITIFAAIGSITYGYAASIIGQVIGQPQFYNYFALAQKGPDTGAMNGLFFAGGALGSLSIAYTASAFGRLRTIQIACMVCILGAALMAGAANVAMYLASRFIMGWGVGQMVCGVGSYQKVLDGVRHSSLFFQKVADGKTVLMKGRNDEAFQVIQRLHAQPDDPDDTFARKEFYQMTQQFALDEQKKQNLGVVHWWDYFKKASYRRRILIGCGATLSSACSGNLVVNSLKHAKHRRRKSDYQVTLYTGLGITGGIPILLFAIWNIVGMLGNIVAATALMDRFGRKICLLIGIAGTATCLAFEAALTKYFVGQETPNKVGLGFGTFFIFFYVVFYATFIDAQQYVVVSEAFPMEFRSIGVALSLFAQTAAAALFVGVAPVSFTHIGWKFYLVFICLDVCTFTLVWVFFPETKGLSLEEINELFGDPVAVHITHDQEDDLDKKIQDMSIVGVDYTHEEKA